MRTEGLFVYLQIESGIKQEQAVLMVDRNCLLPGLSLMRGPGCRVCRCREFHGISRAKIVIYGGVLL